MSVVLGASLLAPRAARADEPESAPAQAPAPAPVDPIAEEARAHHRRGLELYDEGDYRLALVEFERAYAIGKSFKVLFNIGQVHYQMASYARARVALERYLAEGGANIPEKRRADVAKDLAALRQRTATLSVTVNVEGAEVTIGDLVLGTAPLEKAIVDAGTFRVQASRPGYLPKARVVTLAGGDVEAVHLELAPMTAGVVVAPESAGLPGAAVASWIVTGVLFAGAVGTGTATLAAASAYESKRETPVSGSAEQGRAELERQRDLVRGLAITTDVLAVAAAAGAGLSLYLTLKPRTSQPDAARLRVRGAGAAMEVAF